MSAAFIALLDAKTLWYVTRATGVVSLVLLTASVLLGITEAVRWASDRWPRFVTAGIHKNVSLVATSFIVVHIVTAIVDGFAPIGWLDTVVPFRSGYRPIWLGLGTVAFDLLLALALTSLVRQRIGHRWWRAVHWAAYACWPVALVHGLGTGTDTTTTAFFDLEVLCMVAVVLAIWWRVVAGWPGRERQRIIAVVASAVAPLAIGLWAFAGPLQPGWARRAGTPAALLGGTAAPADGTNAPDGGAAGDTQPVAAPSPGLTTPFDASVAGTVRDPGPDRRGNETITIDMTLTDGASGSLQVVLNGRANVDGGGVSLESSTVTLTSADGTETLTGSVTTLRGDVIDARLQSPSGAAVSLELQLSIDDGRVTGTAHGGSA